MGNTAFKEAFVEARYLIWSQYWHRSQYHRKSADQEQREIARGGEEEALQKEQNEQQSKAATKGEHVIVYAVVLLRNEILRLVCFQM